MITFPTRNSRYMVYAYSPKILKETGGFGRYQWILFVFYQLSVLTLLANWIFMAFGGYVPPKCATSSVDYLQDRQDFSLNGTVANGSSLLNASLSNTCKSYFYSIVEEWQMDTTELRMVPSLITTAQMIGTFFGPIVGGQLSDNYGRKRIMLLSSAMLHLLGALSAFSPSWQVFTAFRVGIGFFAGMSAVIQYVLLVEVIPAKWRQITYFGGWPLGYVFLGGVAHFFRHWRHLSVALNAVGILPLLILIFGVVESPKWLLEKGRPSEAKEIFRIIAKRNGRTLPDDVFNKATMYLLATDTVLVNQKRKTRYSYHDLFCSGKLLAFYTLVLSLTSITVSWISYAVVFNIGKLSGDPAVNTILMGLVRWLMSIAAAGMDRKFAWFGRKVIIQLGYWGILLSLISMCVLQVTDPGAVKTFAYAALSTLIVGFCTFVWMASGFYQQEIFPTALRTMGNAFCSCAARIGNVMAPQMALLEFLWLPAANVAMIAFCAANSLLTFFCLPETKGKPLPDIASYRLRYAKKRSSANKAAEIMVGVQPVQQLELLENGATNNVGGNSQKDNDDTEDLETEPFASEPI